MNMVHGAAWCFALKEFKTYSNTFLQLSGYFHECKAVIAGGNEGQNYVNETNVVINLNFI